MKLILISFNEYTKWSQLKSFLDPLSYFAEPMEVLNTYSTSLYNLDLKVFNIKGQCSYHIVI